MPDGESRLNRLKWALDVTRNSIDEVDADKRSPLIAQYRALLAEISELEAAEPDVARGEVNGLVVLQEELAKRRQSGATPPRRAQRRSV